MPTDLNTRFFEKGLMDAEFWFYQKHQRFIIGDAFGHNVID